MFVRTVVGLTLACFALTVTTADAKNKDDRWVPPGLSDEERAEWRDGRPPGWSQGQKKGWRGKSCPPGQAKKGRCGDGTMAVGGNAPVLDPIQQAIERIRDWARGRRVSAGTLDGMIMGFMGAVHHGVSIPVAERFVITSAERGTAAAGIEVLTRALAYGVHRGVAPDQLQHFADSGLSRGIAADAVALGLYRLGAEARR